MNKEKRPSFTRWEREKVKKLYNEGANISQIFLETGVMKPVIEYMIYNIPTFRHKTLNWVEYKRCLCCKVWKTKEDEYNKSWKTASWTQLYKSTCKYCAWIKMSNDFKLWKIDLEKAYARNKKWRDKNPWYFKKRKAKMIKEWTYGIRKKRMAKAQSEVRQKERDKKYQNLILLAEEKRKNEFKNMWKSK